MTLALAGGTAFAENQGGAPGGGEGAGSGGGQITPRSSIPGFRLVAVNRCSRTISMAYRVKDYTGIWVTRGWFHISPGRTRTLSMPTRNKVFYYFGNMTGGQFTWGGKGKPGSVQRWVRTKRFLHASGILSGAGARRVSFRKRSVPATGTYRLNMTCGGG